MILGSVLVRNEREAASLSAVRQVGTYINDCNPTNCDGTTCRLLSSCRARKLGICLLPDEGLRRGLRTGNYSYADGHNLVSFS